MLALQILEKTARTLLLSTAAIFGFMTDVFGISLFFNITKCKKFTRLV